MKLDLPRVSVVICTDGRANALRNTLECLRFLDYASFEVCVVYGPTKDGTEDVLNDYIGRIRIASNDARNLSISRNIGIAMSAAPIVAFIDDDGLPEPEWLTEIELAFRDPDVAGAGGIVYDHTGTAPQYLYSSADRLARADWQRATPANDYNFPLSFNFPYVQGTNSAFRRDLLIEAGGFDEEFEFYLDETDVCCRLVDQGHIIRQLSNAVVHHKFLPSAIRTERRVTRHRYSVIKNKIYFSLINNREHVSTDTVIRDACKFIDEHAQDIVWHIEQKNLDPKDLEDYWNDVDRAWRIGLTRGLSGTRRLIRSETLSAHTGSFLEYRGLVPAGGRRTYCFISGEYPPNSAGGIGRYVHQLARSVAQIGHHVHVFTKGDSHDRIDFEEGTWVHRLLPAGSHSLPGENVIPDHIAAHSVSMARGVASVVEKRPVSAVCAPIWDCEAVALLDNQDLIVCTLLVTMLKSWVESHPHVTEDNKFMQDFVNPMLLLEGYVLTQSSGIIAPSDAIIKSVGEDYGLHFDDGQIVTIPLGLEDWSKLPHDVPYSAQLEGVRILFVGRLEARKGIDVLLACCDQLLFENPQAFIDIVGNDTIAGPEGKTWRQTFENGPLRKEVRERVRFHGVVSDKLLRGFYRCCDIFVAPSRFESFGLILVEAMMFGKAIVACDAGGMSEVLEHGQNGLLVEAGNVAALGLQLECLIRDEQLRRALGEAARKRYESKFSPERMATAVLQFLGSLEKDRCILSSSVS